MLLYGLPAKRSAARVQLWRQLKRFGALPLKTSGYVLPNDAVQLERFQWLSRQIQDAGGQATLIRVAKIEGLSDANITAMFNEARAAEYKELAASCRDQLARHRKGDEGALAAELEKYRRRFLEIREVDYFQSPGAHDAEMVLQRAERALVPNPGPVSARKLDARAYAGKLWLTRPRPGIDRAASAWLIRKFIDPKAKFIFDMDPRKHPLALPFDMADAEFSHHGDDCTFETLAKRFGIDERAVREMAEMVHDADLEDDKFHRSECLGINGALSGWARAGLSDDDLLARGMDLFEGLYHWLRK